MDGTYLLYKVLFCCIEYNDSFCQQYVHNSHVIYSKESQDNVPGKTTSDRSITLPLYRATTIIVTI